MDKDEQAIGRVFADWKSRHPNPGLVLLTEAREKAIRARLRDGHTVEQLIVLIEYAHHALSGEARWWRGDNPQTRTYLDLVELLRASKTAGRVERAWAWKHGLRGAPAPAEGQFVAEDDETTEQVGNVNLGPMGRFRGPVLATPPPAGQPVRGRVVRRG